MKYGLSILFVVAIFFGLGYWYQTVLAVCDVPITYRIGDIDARFNLSTEEVRNAVSTAESLWEDGTDRNLFTYDPNGELVVKFVYDERQASTEAQVVLEETLAKKENVSESVRTEYETLVKKYTALKDTYEASVDAYEAKLRSYNKEVADWNAKGGAPKDVFNRLERTKSELSAEEKRLSSLSRDLNTLVSKINALGARGNDIVSDYNELVSEYNEEFGDAKEFTQGEYTNRVITIYEYKSKDELAIVLAHELGHALGLTHVDGESSIMYHHMGAQSLDDGLTAYDSAAFTQTCGVSENNMAETLLRIKALLLSMLRSLET